MASVDPPASFTVNREFIRRSMSAALLSRERELWLARLWRDAGDEAALHELVMAYMRLVISTARFRNYGLPMGDLVQEGATGLMQAAARFEPERESVSRPTQPGGSAPPCRTTFSGTGPSCAPARPRQKALFFNLRRLRAKIGDGSGGPLDEAGRAFIASELSVNIDEVAAMEMRLAGGDQSLNATVSPTGEDEWQDFLADERPTPKRP